MLPDIDTNYLIKSLVDLLNIPSPTGFADQAIAFVEKELSQYSFLQLAHAHKGALVAKWAGQSDSSPRALTAHILTFNLWAER